MTIRSFNRSITLPGDKSLSHRALMLSTLLSGMTGPVEIQGLLESDDVRSTQYCMEALGATIQQKGNLYYLMPPKQLREPSGILDCGNSGTTTRLLTGLLAAQPFYSVLTGDESICKRPMGRVLKPLTQMGAQVYGRANNTLAPLTILPCVSGLSGISYKMPVASAQVKSAILLAGLFAGQPVCVQEQTPSRDHTETMLQALGVGLTVERSAEGCQITLAPGGAEYLMQSQERLQWQIPADFSSAAFWIAAALLLPGSEVTLPNVGLNPTRTGLLNALAQWGARVQIENERTQCGEPVGDLLIQHTPLSGSLTLTAAEIPSCVDELPMLAVLGSMTQGQLQVTGAEELRSKESDRIAAICVNLRPFGIAVEETPDGFLVEGNPEQMTRVAREQPIHIQTFHDHRIAMAFAVLNRALTGQVDWTYDDLSCMSISYPGFLAQLQQV